MLFVLVRRVLAGRRAAASRRGTSFHGQLGLIFRVRCRAWTARRAGMCQIRPVNWDASNDGPVSTATASSFLNAAGMMGRVTISERIFDIAAWVRADDGGIADPADPALALALPAAGRPPPHPARPVLGVLSQTR